MNTHALHALITHLRTQLQDTPDDADLTASLAGALAQMGQFDEARRLLEDAYALNTATPVVIHNLAELYRNTGQLESAERLFEDLMNAGSPYLPSVVSLIALLTQRLYADKKTLLKLARLHTLHAEALLVQCQYGAAAQAFRQALRYAPDEGGLQGRLADTLRLMGRPSEAVQMSNEYLANNGDDAGAWNTLGCALVDLGRLEEAQVCFERSLLLKPNALEVRHNLGSGAMLNRLYQPGMSARELFEIHQDWGRSVFAELPPRPAQTFDGQRRCRIGFVSGDFRYHAMGYFIEPLLRHLDANRIELFCYDTAPGVDAVAQRLQALPLHWRNVSGLDQVALGNKMRADGLDLLLDLMGHTHGMNRLNALATRPAPVMAVWLGYPFTTGFAGFDYRIADVWTDPLQSQDVNTETLALLARSQFCYSPASDALPAEILPADENGGRVTFGSRNAARKINVEVVKVWAKILRAMPGSRLLLQASGLDDQGTVGRLQGLFEAFGIGSHRLCLEGFKPSITSIETYNRIDVALDTFPFNGGATTCDALWMGVPVVCLAGEASFARMGVSILHAIGRDDWIAHTGDDYVARAIALASDLPLLRRLRKTLRNQMQEGPLCDEVGFAREFGELLLRLSKNRIT